MSARAMIDLFQSTPPARGATSSMGMMAQKPVFQATPPARGATPYYQLFVLSPVFQSTPPARGATACRFGLHYTRHISIHAPREGGDNIIAPKPIKKKISIHAPREGGDHSLFNGMSWPSDFNPRPPRGGRLPATADGASAAVFQSTPPARGATLSQSFFVLEVNISIHAPREGGD